MTSGWGSRRRRALAGLLVLLLLLLLGPGASPSLAAGTGSISGVVTANGGQPLGDVCVSAHRSWQEFHSDRTDASGQYELRDLGEGYWEVEFGCWNGPWVQERYDDGQRSGGHLVPVSGAAVSGVDAELLLGGEVQGRVVDDAGQPVAGAAVQGRGPGWPRSADTGPDGTWRVAGVRPGTYELTATRWGNSPVQMGQVVVASGRAVVVPDAVMPRQADVSGTVRDQAGAPVEHACLSVETTDGGHRSGWAFTDAAGQFTMQGIEPGELRLWATDCRVQGRFAPGQSAPFTASRGQHVTGVDVTVSPGGSVSGTVTLPGGGPATDACVTVASERFTSGYAWTRTGADGGYRVTGLPTNSFHVLFSPCDPTANLLSGYYDGAASRETATLVAVTEGQETTGIDHRLTEGSALEGTVAGAEGEPVAGACVAARSEGPAAAEAWASTGADGRYRVHALPAGAYTVRFVPCQATAYAEQWYGGDHDGTNVQVDVPAAATVTGIDATLVRAARIEGRVSDDAGRALSPVCVEALDQAGRVRPGDGSAVPTSPDTYVKAGLPPGTYTVRATDCTGTGWFAPAWHGGEDEADATPVTVAAGGVATGVDITFTRPGPPRVTGIVPAEGPEAGGATVSIVGTGLAGATEVRFGDGAVPFTTVSRNQLDAVSPAGAAGTSVSVTVTTAGGAAQAPGLFTFVAAPTVTAVEPGAGPERGGTAVTITGDRLDRATAVAFAGRPAASFTVEGPGRITATTAGGPPGPTTVEVTTPGGTARCDCFTYLAAPVVHAVSPSSGPATGGTEVTITGAHLTGATAVHFGEAASPSFEVRSDGEVRAVTAPGSHGALVDVRVTGPGGTGAAPDAFYYDGAPVVAGVSPGEGPEHGGTEVEITGFGFATASAVTFGGQDASFTVVGEDRILAVTPPGSGKVDVVVTNAGGASAPAEAARFGYVPAPALWFVAPPEGPLAGGTTVTVLGWALDRVTSLTFGGMPVPFTVEGPDRLVAVTPPGQAGPVLVAVESAGGWSACWCFTYRHAPSVFAVSPPQVAPEGGDEVTIHGADFRGAFEVQFGATPAPAFDVLDDGAIRAVVPPGPAGQTADVSVTGPGGTGTLAGALTWVRPPEVTGLTPDRGTVLGGTAVTVRGAGFTGATEVVLESSGPLGGRTPVPFTVAHDGELSFTTPAHLPGPAVVRVTTPVGTSPAAPAATYTFTVLAV